MTDESRAVELAARSLASATRGDLEEACRYADEASDRGSRLGVALSTYLRTSRHADVYDQPAAFEAFISGGGNIDLYRATSSTLSGAYPGVGALLDIGCGNGMALVPALQSGPTVPGVIDLVEPGAALLAHCLEAIRATGLPITATGWQMDLTDFLRSVPADQRWQLAESTFALQSIEPVERRAALTQLASRVDRLVVVDFDVDADSNEKPDSAAHLRSLAERYESGLAEYDDTRELVAQGFLMPVLLGQLTATTERTNWEHPAGFWADQVAAAGFRDVQVRRLTDYWSAPAFVLTAVGR